MRLLPVLLLLLAIPCSAQTASFWLFGGRPPAAIPVVMPRTLNDHGYNGARWKIDNDSTYRAKFPDSVQYRLPAIDFDRYELHSITSCMQCAHCEMPQCHRNACRYTRSWYLLDKNALVPVNPDTIARTSCHFGDDTLYASDSALAGGVLHCPEIQAWSPDFNKSVALVRHGFSDCHARITHEILLDTANRCLVWRLYETYGGCRAGLPYTYVATVPRPPEGYRIVLEEYPFERRR